jgi:hypothetical protein
MAAPVSTGMDKGEMKKLLMKSKQEPVNCAIGLGDDPSLGLLLLDRIKQPKAVEKELTKQIPAAKNTRWGTALVDVEDNPKLVKISINKPISGMARKLVKTLKGTGFTKVQILLDDGSPVEAYTEEEEGQPAAASEPAQAAAPPPTPQEEEAPKPDLAALEARLKALIPRVAQLGAADPRREDLTKRARQANVLLKTNNLVYAAAEIESLSRALDTPAAAQPAAADGTKGDLGKSSQIWLLTRKRMEDEIAKLRASIVAAYQGEPSAAEIEKRFTDRTAPLLQTLDGTLAEALDAAAQAKDPAEQAKLVEQAKAVLARYESFAGSDPLLADLDANPFVPLAIQKTVTATLAALSKTLH